MTIKELYENAYYTDREDYKVVIYQDNSYGWYDASDVEFDDENKEIIIKG